MYIMRSYNKPIYLITKIVFLCFKLRSYIKITILILSTYFNLFFTFSNHLYFFLVLLSDYFKYKKSIIFIFYKYLFRTIYLLLYIKQN